MENKPAPYQNDSKTLAGSNPVEVGKIVNGIFEVFLINYPFWNHGLTEDQINAKKRLWISRLQRFSGQAINEAVDEVIDVIGDKSGPTMKQFLDIAHSMRRAKNRTAENDAIAHAKGYDSWDELCREQKIGVYWDSSSDLVTLK